MIRFCDIFYSLRIVTSFSLGSRIRPGLGCGLRAVCEANKRLLDQSEANSRALDQSEAMTEIGSLVLINALPLGPEDTRNMMMAGRLGRLMGELIQADKIAHSGVYLA